MFEKPTYLCPYLIASYDLNLIYWQVQLKIRLDWRPAPQKTNLILVQKSFSATKTLQYTYQVHRGMSRYKRN